MSLGRRLVRSFDILRQRLYRKPLRPPSERERYLADEFRKKIHRLTIEIDPSMSASELVWRKNMLRLKELAMQGDPREFLSWDVVSRTMFVKYAKYSRAEHKYLKEQPDWPRWKSALVENNAGNPALCPFDTTTSCSLLHHAYHVAQYERATGSRVDSYDFVLEFGGGYGSMCRLLYKLGFDGRYLIVDLAAFSVLQEYFLESAGINVLTEVEFLSGKPGVLCVTDIESLEKFVGKKTNSLMIATWSLSESPLPVRSRVMDAARSFDGFLLAFQPRFEEIDNAQFFDEWKSRKSNYVWHSQEIKYQPKQRYLFGKSVESA